MPVTIQEVSVETVPEPTPPADNPRAGWAERSNESARQLMHELPRQLAQWREREDRLHAH